MRKKKYSLLSILVVSVICLTACNKNDINNEESTTGTTASNVVTTSDTPLETTEYQPVKIGAETEYTFKYTDIGALDALDAIKAEIFIPAIDLNYYVVQTDDNEYYLDHDEYGNDSKAGAIYGDYRNNFEYLDDNNVIYGHNMADGSMFGTLQRLKDNATFSEEEDLYIYLNSRGYQNIFKICSMYEIDLKSFNYIQTGFKDDLDKLLFINNVIAYNESTAVNPNEIPDEAKLLTLSTCTNGGKHRFVVHGYLIARKAN